MRAVDRKKDASDLEYLMPLAAKYEAQWVEMEELRNFIDNHLHSCRLNEQNHEELKAKYEYILSMFQPERFQGNSVDADYLGSHFEYIPFGTGKRMCPAIAFGAANVEFVLTWLLYYFDWKLPVGMRPEDLDMTESGTFATSRKGSLNLIATPYAPAFKK